MQINQRIPWQFLFLESITYFLTYQFQLKYIWNGSRKAKRDTTEYAYMHRL